MFNYSAQTLLAALEFNFTVSTVLSTNTVQLLNAQPHPAILLPAALWFNSYCSTVCSTDTVPLKIPKEIPLATTRSLLSTAWNPLVLAGLVREPGYLARDKFGTKLKTNNIS